MSIEGAPNQTEDAELKVETSQQSRQEESKAPGGFLDALYHAQDVMANSLGLGGKFGTVKFEKGENPAKNKEGVE